MSIKEREKFRDINGNDDDEFEDMQEDKYLTFSLNREEYGIDIKSVIEIIGIQNITSVPDMPPYVRGVINLRGKIIPVMDVRARFSISEKKYDERTCIIVIKVDEQLVGLIVDEVSDVLDIPGSNIEPPPKISGGGTGRFVRGMGKYDDKVIILLNTDKILFEEDLKLLNQIQ